MTVPWLSTGGTAGSVETVGPAVCIGGIPLLYSTGPLAFIGGMASTAIVGGITSGNACDEA